MEGNAARSFDMRHMSNALPPSNTGQVPMRGRRPSNQYVMPTQSGMMGPNPYQYNAQASQYGQQSPDAAAFARAQPQQQPYLPHNYAAPPAHYQMAGRPQPAQIQTQPPYPRVDPYAYGVAHPSYSPVDMRYPQQSYPVGYGAAGGYADMSGFPADFRRKIERADAILFNRSIPSPRL